MRVATSLEQVAILSRDGDHALNSRKARGISHQQTRHHS